MWARKILVFALILSYMLQAYTPNISAEEVVEIRGKKKYDTSVTYDTPVIFIDAELELDSDVSITTTCRLTIINTIITGGAGITVNGEPAQVDGLTGTQCTRLLTINSDNGVYNQVSSVDTYAPRVVMVYGDYNVLRGFDLSYNEGKSFLEIRGSYNKVINGDFHDYSLQDLPGDENAYAIIITGSSHHNYVEGCRAWRVGEPLVDTWMSHHNVWVDCVAHGCHWGKVTQFYTHHIRATNLTIYNIRYTAFMTEHESRDNYFTDCTVQTSNIGYRMKTNAQNTTFDRCVAFGCPNLKSYYFYDLTACEVVDVWLLPNMLSLRYGARANFTYHDDGLKFTLELGEYDTVRLVELEKTSTYIKAVLEGQGEINIMYSMDGFFARYYDVTEGTYYFPVPSSTPPAQPHPMPPPVEPPEEPTKGNKYHDEKPGKDDKNDEKKPKKNK